MYGYDQNILKKSLGDDSVNTEFLSKFNNKAQTSKTNQDLIVDETKASNMERLNVNEEQNDKQNHVTLEGEMEKTNYETKLFKRRDTYQTLI